MFRQDLYWSNLPTKRLSIKADSNIHNLIRKTFLKKEKNPFFLFTGTNNIDFSNSHLQNIKLQKKIKKRKISIFLYEPLSYYFIGDDYNLGYYSEFHNQFDIDDRLRAEELDCIQNFALQIGSKIDVNVCDYKASNLLKNFYPNLEIKCRDIFLRQAACSWMPIWFFNANKIKKHFWCGNARYTIHRHIVMCKLAHYEGNYSWFFKSDCNWNIQKNWVEEEIVSKEILQGNDILNKNNFYLDFQTDQIETLEKDGYYMPSGDFSQPSLTYKKTFDECFVAIINETRFAQPTGNFSEKIIDAINYGKPFIVVAPPKTLEYMKKMEFKSFSDFWDEDYDQIQNHSERMKRILSLIDFISNLSINEIQEMYVKMFPILEHNRKIMKKLPQNNKVIN